MEAGEIGDLAVAVDGAGDTGGPNGEPGGVPGGVGSRSEARGTDAAESADMFMEPTPVSSTACGWMGWLGWRKMSRRILAWVSIISSMSG